MVTSNKILNGYSVISMHQNLPEKNIIFWSNNIGNIQRINIDEIFAVGQGAAVQIENRGAPR